VPLLIRIFVRVQGGWIFRTAVYMEYMRIAEIHSTQKSGEKTINRDTRKLGKLVITVSIMT